MKRYVRAGAVAVATLLKSKKAALQVGDPAPWFAATSTKGEVKLNQFLAQGPVILALYYADFTPG